MQIYFVRRRNFVSLQWYNKKFFITKNAKGAKKLFLVVRVVFKKQRTFYFIKDNEDNLGQLFHYEKHGKDENNVLAE